MYQLLPLLIGTCLLLLGAFLHYYDRKIIAFVLLLAADILVFEPEHLIDSQMLARIVAVDLTIRWVCEKLRQRQAQANRNNEHNHNNDYQEFEYQ